MTLSPKTYNRFSKDLTSAGKWLLGLNGAGLAASFGIIITNYSAVSQASSCQAITYISQLVNAGGSFAGFFLLAAIFAMISVLIPYPIIYLAKLYNFLAATNEFFRRIDTYKFFHNSNLKEILEGFLFLRALAVVASFSLLLVYIFNIVLLGKHATPERLMSDWKLSGEHCPPPRTCFLTVLASRMASPSV